ncbi:MAG: glycosyltransferase [Alphaproteobacteria bacterium]|nr:glycosyltransferase [Alphaproteobacteria bacterium]
MKILIVTDAWYPQINGVVRTLTKTYTHLKEMGHEVELITPQSFRTIPCPTYPEIRLSVFPGRRVAKKIKHFQPNAIHIATEGPLGLAARRYAIWSGLRFTTAYHTRFPEYLHSRTRLPLSITYWFLRWFHGASHAVMAPTKTVINDLVKWRIGRPVLWPRGVDLNTFNPDNCESDKGTDEAYVTSITRLDTAKKPIFIYVGRVAVEKNLSAFLELELPGEKHVVGDGPALQNLKRRFPEAVFHGAKSMEQLPAYYNRADVFVFPSRTDTFGLVLLEAMGCGLPVAAFPVTGPIDVVGNSGAGALNEDLRRACLAALNIDRAVARQHAETFSWQSATTIFESHLINSQSDAHEYHFSQNPYKDNMGITRAIAAAKHSLAGMIFAIREESAFRQELLLAAFLIPLAIWLPASLSEKILMLLSTVLVLVVELLNSSVEAAIDRISFDQHGLSKRAKDYGSAAVMLALLICAGVHGIFLLRWWHT